MALEGKYKIRRTRAFSVLAAIIALFVPFQNCTHRAAFSGPGQSVTTIKSNGSDTMNNGSGYNGKVTFAKNASCGVEIKISVRLGEKPFPDAAFLTRENCADIAERPLQLGSEAVLSADLNSLTYAGANLMRDFSLDSPYTPPSHHIYVSINGNDTNPGTSNQPYRGPWFLKGRLNPLHFSREY
jgi:hypothetical protein